MATKQEEHNRGQKDYSKTKDDLGGPTKHTPWASVSESTDEYLEKLDAYHKGFDNAAKNNK